MLRIFTLTCLLAIFHCSESFSNYPKGLTPPRPLKISVSSIGPRIVGGRNATIEEFPYVASLQHYWEEYVHDTIHFCTGTIISQDWIITTAMCARLIEFENVTVRVGSSFFHEGGIVYGIETYTIHPQFNMDDMDYDIAVLKLNSSLQFSATVQPIRMIGARRSIPEDTIFTMTSWGANDFLDDVAVQLNTIDLPTISTELCKTVWDERITDRMFCAYEEWVGMCAGDAGAPAVINGTVIGMASFTYACSAWGFPSVYTDLSSLSEWVTAMTGVSSAFCSAPFGDLIFSILIVLKILFQ